MKKLENKSSKKAGMIRYSGVIAFAVVSLVLVLSFYLVVPYLVEKSIEGAGTELAGAEVDVASVDLSLFPAGLVVHGLAVTDAQSPMQNLFEVLRAEASVDLLKLWMGQVIIEDLSLEALQFDTPRKRSGEIAQTNDKGAEEQAEQEQNFLAEEVEQLSSALPDTKELLSRQPLLTDKLKTELEANYKKKKSEWDKVSSKLPDEQKLDYYQAEFKALTEGDITSLQDFNERKQKFDELKAELKQDKVQVLLAKDQLRESQGLIKQGMKDLRAAPQKDWQAIKQKYSFDESGALNITGLLFGDQFAHYAERTLHWYRKLAPLMQSEDSATDGEQAAKAPQRGSGRFIRFTETDTSPDFLVRHASAKAILSHGNLDIVAKDLTHQQFITHKPSTFEAYGSSLKNPQALDFALSIDHREALSKDKLKLNIVQQRFDQLSLSDSKSMPLSMQHALMDLSAKLTLNDEDLTGDVRAYFTQAKLVGEGQTTLAKEVAATLGQVESFSLDADIGGQLSSPDIGLRSNLDAMLKNAFAARLKQKQAEWEAKIKAELNQKLNGYLAENEALAGYFSEQTSLVDSDLGQIDELLSKQLANYADQQKNKAKSKVESKLKGALKGLF